MNVSQAFKLAIKSLQTSKMRAFLTMLGIIIGVGAVIIIISLGNGLTGMVEQQVEKVGINQVYVYDWGWGDGALKVGPDRIFALVESRPDVFAGVTPWVGTSAGVRKGARI
jgi:putative ABC transport system permease protein